MVKEAIPTEPTEKKSEFEVQSPQSDPELTSADNAVESSDPHGQQGRTETAMQTGMGRLRMGPEMPRTQDPGAERKECVSSFGSGEPKAAAVAANTVDSVTSTFGPPATSSVVAALATPTGPSARADRRREARMGRRACRERRRPGALKMSPPHSHGAKRDDDCADFDFKAEGELSFVDAIASRTSGQGSKRATFKFGENDPTNNDDKTVAEGGQVKSLSSPSIMTSGDNVSRSIGESKLVEKVNALAISAQATFTKNDFVDDDEAKSSLSSTTSFKKEEGSKKIEISDRSSSSSSSSVDGPLVESNDKSDRELSGSIPKSSSESTGAEVAAEKSKPKGQTETVMQAVMGHLRLGPEMPSAQDAGVVLAESADEYVGEAGLKDLCAAADGRAKSGAFQRASAGVLKGRRMLKVGGWCKASKKVKGNQKFELPGMSSSVSDIARSDDSGGATKKGKRIDDESMLVTMLYILHAMHKILAEQRGYDHALSFQDFIVELRGGDEGEESEEAVALIVALDGLSSEELKSVFIQMMQEKRRISQALKESEGRAGLTLNGLIMQMTQEAKKGKEAGQTANIELEDILAHLEAEGQIKKKSGFESWMANLPDWSDRSKKEERKWMEREMASLLCNQAWEGRRTSDPPTADVDGAVS